MLSISRICGTVGVQLISGSRPFSAVSSSVVSLRLQAMPTSSCVIGFGMMCHFSPCQTVPFQSNGSGASQALRISSTASRNMMRGSCASVPRCLLLCALMPTPKPAI